MSVDDGASLRWHQVLELRLALVACACAAVIVLLRPSGWVHDRSGYVDIADRWVGRFIATAGAGAFFWALLWLVSPTSRFLPLAAAGCFGLALTVSELLGDDAGSGGLVSPKESWGCLPA